jgi:arginine deiminase
MTWRDFQPKVCSEVAPLKAVLTHRPGRELENLTPRYLGDLLFDEIPWLRRAKAEHDAFVTAMRADGVNVLYIEDLVADVVTSDALRSELIGRQLAFNSMKQRRVADAMADYLMNMPLDKCVAALMAGIRKADLGNLDDEHSLSHLVRRSFPFYLSPLPSMYFTRDQGIVIGDRLLLSQMFNFARRRETEFLRFVAEHHPLFARTPLIINEEYPTGLEGGDVMVISADTVMIGMSERTTEAAIEYVAGRLLGGEGPIARVIVVEIPARRAYMHLDTVLTMVDEDKFIIYPGVEGQMQVYELTRGEDGRVWAQTCGDLRTTLSRVLGRDVTMIRSGGDDPITSAREQWADSTNTLALSPGKVILYNRNEATNAILRAHGLSVVEFEGSELGRGRGGPHCMTMPLWREA